MARLQNKPTRKKPFCDPNFKAGVRHIMLDSMILLNKRVQTWEHFSWRRPNEIFLNSDKKPEFFLYLDIKPADIRQGHCGDCYFLSCLSSIAEYPERIKNIFV